jgi:hypothetical protein
MLAFSETIKYLNYLKESAGVSRFSPAPYKKVKNVEEKRSDRKKRS